MASVGDVVSTGNSTIAVLPVGSVLVVSGQGEFTIDSIPEVAVKPGTEFTSKRGNEAVVVDLTSTGGLNSAHAEGVVFYVEYNVNRVRRTTVDFVRANLL